MVTRREIQRSIVVLFLLGFVCLVALPVFAEGLVCETCLPCHNGHDDFDHGAVPGSGPVAIFADRTHDDAAWAYGQPGPHFDIMADCSACHRADLPDVHGNECSTCHPTPYDSLGTWNKSCQQANCHPSIHEQIVPSHDPFEDAYDSLGNDCLRCHDGPTWQVTTDKCLNCHAAAVETNSSPPSTVAKNVQGTYIGPARIDFSVTDNGKVGVGRTYYRLNGGPVTAAGKYAFIDDDNTGTQELEFWSKDQNGNVETTHHTTQFDILEDVEPPQTTSNAKANYTNGGQISLTATDNSTMGVKNTFYRLTIDGQPESAAVSGNIINLPATQGSVCYTLEFWSVDWAGNVEPSQTVTFCVTSGNGTIRLVWWDCDVNTSHCPTYGDSIDWKIRLNTSSGYVYKSGSSVYGSGWTGVNNISVPVRSTPYFVWVEWSWQDEEDMGIETGTVYVTSPGQVVKFNY